MTDDSEVLAVVIAFNPEAHLEVLCATLVAEGCSVLVIDNASVTGRGVLRACEDAGAEVLHLADNIGVSGALVMGHHRAEGHTWLLTFDQDSVVDAGFVKALLTSPATQESQVAVIGPRVVDAASGHPLQGATVDEQHARVPLVITSGALCRVSALDDVGGFRADLFIDHVDHDICLRLRRRGWSIVIEPAAVMRHSIGQMRTHRVVAGLGVRNSHHSADRQYYKYRNYLLLLRDGTAWTDRRWTLRTGLALGWGPLKVLAFEDAKAAKLRAMGAGLRDGLRGHGGSRVAAGGRP